MQRGIGSVVASWLLGLLLVAAPVASANGSGHHRTPGLTPARVATDPSGRVLVASGNARALLVTRYLPDGRLDRSFGGDGTGEVSLDRFVSGADPEEGRGGSGIADATAIALQPNGRILVAGAIDTELGVEWGDVTVLARLRPDGAIDRSFGGGGNFRPAAGQVNFEIDVNSILPLRDKIVLAGRSNRGVVIRLLADGSLDPSFGVGKRPGKVALPAPPKNRTRYHVDAGFEGVVPGPHGTIYAAGFDLGALLLVRLRSDGALDRSFAGHGMVEVNPSDRSRCGCFSGGFLARDQRGRLLVAGSLEARSGVARHKPSVIARYLADGNLDRSFGDEGFARVSANTATYAAGVAVDRQGRIVLTGSSATAHPQHGDGPESFTVIRLRSNGRRDWAFFGDGVFKSRFGGSAAAATNARIDPSGTLVVGGAVYHGLRRGRLVEHALLARFP